METPDWSDLSGFTKQHYLIIDKACVIIASDPEPVAKLAREIWTASRKIANRTPMSLCFDCVYIAANALGVPASKSFVKFVSNKVVGKSITPMVSNKGAKGDRWFISKEGKDAIMDVIDDEDIYEDLFKEWL
tara:strand:- start:164 stop:559 length:396 start_codon:yes stop_codon:yes gene_type:complete